LEQVRQLAKISPDNDESFGITASIGISLKQEQIGESWQAAD